MEKARKTRLQRASRAFLHPLCAHFHGRYVKFGVCALFTARLHASFYRSDSRIRWRRGRACLMLTLHKSGLFVIGLQASRYGRA